ncbi:MAG: phosphopantothenate/pantothenate synthetase [Thermoplasmatales archaeon]|nr:MAG: phosphopantothenate/pantothenate synthetase [Thermoplasmatales archaeon]
MEKIPKSHPRYTSLTTREIISQGIKNGIVHETGLIAHGRGEAFDYLLGEKTIPQADMAEKVAAAALLCAKNPVISVNGNVVSLVAKDCIKLAESIPAKLEVNLFHRTKKRIEKISKELSNYGAKNVYGQKADAKIPGLEHDRALCDMEGIFSADVVLVPLEDGDRCQALRNMGKTVVAIDLNPLSRTARIASITIVDNVTRAISNIERWVNELKNIDKNNLNNLVEKWNNETNLSVMISFISKRLNSLYR